MPSTITVSRRILAPVNVVWDVATDIPGSAAALSGITAVEMLSDGTFGAGTRWRETRAMGRRQVTEEMWVSAVEPLRSYAVESDSRGAHYTSVFTFVPTGADSTEATLDFSAQPRGVVSRVASTLLSPIVTRAVRRALNTDLADLAAAAEAPAAT
jgi:carbon monoxide dehydrogenase subunit G